MTSRCSVLAALVGCLRGEIPARCDWIAIIKLANRSWLTPTLFDALSRSSLRSQIQGDVFDYLAFIHERNLERNRRLRDQLCEVLAALNAMGVEPMLTKGTLNLLSEHDDRLGLRMTCDLDLTIEDDEFDASLACLRHIGYEDISPGGTGTGFGRPQDVGVLEIHCRSSAAAHSLGPALDADVRLVSRGDLRARAQSATMRALHLVVHDQIKEGDYWRGCIDLRHLHDLSELARSEEGVDWNLLLSAMPDRLHRNALSTQILIARRLFGITVPRAPGLSIPRLQYWRCMLQLSFPKAAALLRLSGNIAWIMRRIRTSNVPGWSGRGPIAQAAHFVRKLREGPHATYLALIGADRGPKL